MAWPLSIHRYFNPKKYTLYALLQFLFLFFIWAQFMLQFCYQQNYYTIFFHHPLQQTCSTCSMQRNYLSVQCLILKTGMNYYTIISVRKISAKILFSATFHRYFIGVGSQQRVDDSKCHVWLAKCQINDSRKYRYYPNLWWFVEIPPKYDFQVN